MIGSETSDEADDNGEQTPTDTTCRGSVEVLRLDNSRNESGEPQNNKLQEVQYNEPSGSAFIRYDDVLDDGKQKHRKVSFQNKFDDLKDGTIVCLTAGGGRYLGVYMSASGSVDRLDVIEYGARNSLAHVEWLDGAARLPIVPSECLFVVKKRVDGLIGFSSCVADGRHIKATKYSDGLHSLGGQSLSKHELWRKDDNCDSGLCSVAFPTTEFGWEAVELKCTPTQALRESERCQLREVRKMRTQVQSAELRVRDSDRKSRDNVASIQQEAHTLNVLCDKQQCRIDDLEKSLKDLKQQLKSSQSSVADLDRLVIQMAGEKQRALQDAKLLHEEEVLSLRRELTDAKNTLEGTISNLLTEKKMLENKNDEIVSSLNDMNMQKDAELYDLKEERVRLSATIKDIADRVGSVSPISNRNYNDNEANYALPPDVDMSRTYGGGRRIRGPLPGGFSPVQTRLF